MRHPSKPLLPTWSPVATRLSARVVGTPSACIASLAMYSRMLLRSTARPSAMRLYGVRPAPCRVRGGSRKRQLVWRLCTRLQQGMQRYCMLNAALADSPQHAMRMQTLRSPDCSLVRTAPHLELQLPALALAVHRLAQADGTPIAQLACR